MIRSITTIRAAVVLAALMGAGSASAATVTECIADVSVAQATILAATTFVNPQKDQVRLAATADNAISKLDAGKFGDASVKLSDMARKIDELLNASKPKLGAEDGAAISADIAAAQECVTQLMAQ